ncbi:peptidase [Kitasatospora sp. NPDC018058]|uniref:peptidase n=1 Tax=Kitasatospora sp. NPDC018058 TaxID=3364025 RepID=UPI0037C047FF
MATAVLALICGASTATAEGQGQTPPPAVEGNIGLKLLDAPLDRESDPRAHMYIVDHLAPGTVIHRRLLVTNTSDVDQHVDLYAGSAAVNSGTFIVDADRTPNELTTWVSVDDCVSDADVSSRTTDCGTPGTRPPTPPSTAVRDIPAHGTAVVRVSVRVPSNASAGERYAVLWAQVAGLGGPDGNVRLVNRVGARIYLDVGPGGEPPSDFRIEELTPARESDGTPKLVAKVHNTGKRALDLTGSMSMTDGPGSLSAGPFAVNLGTTLGIDETEPVTVPLDRKLPDGPWKVHLTLASGLVRHTATATITFPNGYRADASVTPEMVDSQPMAPGMAMGVSAVVLLIACGWMVRRRRVS